MPFGALAAGLKALADISMINPPVHPVMAIDRNKVYEEQIDVVKNMDLISD